LLYPQPYGAMLGVGSIFLLILMVDVMCGPILTLLLASPSKTRRALLVDFSLIGVIQLTALVYGLHSVWAARPVALVFEVDRLVVVTANEINPDLLPQAPTGLQRLPYWGVLHAGTRKPANSTEMLQSVQSSLAGLAPSIRPDWWVTWNEAKMIIPARMKPLADLISRRPKSAMVLRSAAAAAGLPVEKLYYLPLVSSKSLDWVALLDANMHMMSWASVDGF
jgi:hypothetical protein